MSREYTREIYLYINGKQINNDIKSIRAEMNLLVNQQARMTNGSQEYVEATKKIKALKAILAEHAASLKEVDKSFGGMLNKLGDVTNRFQTVLMAGAAMAIGLVTGFMKTADAANLFEERLSNLSALTGLNGRELQWLGEKAKETSISVTESGVRIKQCATDIVDAYTKVGSQRPELLKDKEALAAVTEAAIVLSEAGKMELAPATAALTTTMNQFNLEARDANRIINSIAAGSLVGAGEIPYLTECIEKAGTTANLMGISVEQMVGTIEAVAPKFAQAEVAGTSLDRVLLKMREKGIGVKDGVFDLNRAVDELRIEFNSGQSAVDIFGVHQAKMAEILVMNQADMNKYSAAVTDTSIAFEQAGKNTNNMAAKLQQARNKVTLMYIEIGTKLAPAVIVSTNAFNYFLKAIMALPGFVKENQQLLIALAGALLAYNGVLIKSIGLSIINTGVRIKDAVVLKALIIQEEIQIAMTAAQATQTTALTFAQKIAVVTQLALNTAMMQNPVGWAIAGITALVLALNYFNKNSKENIALEGEKKSLTQDLTAANQALKETYTEISGQVGKLNELSVQEKIDLDDKITKTLALAEAELEVLQGRRGDIKASSTKITAFQFVTTMFNPDKRLAKARENALEAVAPQDALIELQKDRIKSLKEQKTELDNLMNAESLADRIGTGSVSEMEAKLQKYTLALKGVLKGGADYIRIQQKIVKVEADLARERGVNEAAGEKFNREKALADLVKFHEEKVLLIKTEYAKGIGDKETYNNDLEQEDIRFQMASAERLAKAGQSTVAEQQKVQDILIKMREDCEKEAEESAKKQKKSIEMWDEEYKKFLEDTQDNPDFTAEQKQNVQDYIYWFNNTAEGQREMAQLELDNDLISKKAYYRKIKELDKDAAEKKLANLEQWAGAATSLAETVGKFMEAQKNKELAQAGTDDKKKAAIEKKYAKRQQDIAVVQAVIEGALEIARINSNSGVNADLTQTLRLILTGLAVARTAGTIAVIKSQQFAEGRYPVMGANDGQIYQASLLGKVRTGIYSKPTLGLFAEKDPEIVIDGPTTRNIRANFPEILETIQSARVTQYASGMYPDLGGTSQQSAMQITALLQANMQMMRQVILAHEKPGTVSFKSIRDTQDDYDFIKSKTTI